MERASGGGRARVVPGRHKSIFCWAVLQTLLAHIFVPAHSVLRCPIDPGTSRFWAGRLAWQVAGGGRYVCESNPGLPKIFRSRRGSNSEKLTPELKS